MCRFMDTEVDLIPAAVKELCDKHGGVRAAARATGINYAYLSRLGNGARSNPTDSVLRKLGLERIVTLRKLNWKASRK
jgi:hypothetical protein